MPAGRARNGRTPMLDRIHGDQVAYHGHLLYTFADD
jgi:hypothetical protein